MIKVTILTIFLLNTVLSVDDFFLSRYEYGKALYENPRGVSCKRCHGIKAKGKVIVKYTHRKKEIIIKTSNLNNITFKKFISVLNGKSKGIMPRYFLSEDEILSLYFYIKSRN